MSRHTSHPFTHKKEKEKEGKRDLCPSKSLSRSLSALTIAILAKASSPAQNYASSFLPMPRTLRFKGQLQGERVMDSKENSDQRMQGSACSQLIHYGRPICISSILSVRWFCHVAHWKLPSPFTDKIPLCLISHHYSLANQRGHTTGLCYWMCRCTDKSPSYHGEQSPEGSVPWQQAERPFQSSYTHAHTHAHIGT